MPCEIVVKTLIDEIEENLKTGKKTFLIDGFPRTSEQHSTFEKVRIIHRSKWWKGRDLRAL